MVNTTSGHGDKCDRLIVFIGLITYNFDSDCVGNLLNYLRNMSQYPQYQPCGAESITPTFLKCKCRPGWIGTFCNQTCPIGKFGYNCSEPCKCSNNSHCDHVTGNCVDISTSLQSCSVDCVSGRCNKHTGKCQLMLPEFQSSSKCAELCYTIFDGVFGRTNCHAICSNVDEMLANVFGASFSAEPVHQGCGPNTFGKICQQCKCPLPNQLCNKRTGECTCQPGWTGPKCDVPNEPIIRPTRGDFVAQIN
ncbi:hypothetical protein ACOME3_003346 [Neoechinorhynchus agilis]